MGKVGIHLENIVVAVLQRPFESGEVGGSQPLFPLAFQQEQPLREFSLKGFDDTGRPVRGAVVNDQNMVSAGKAEHLSDDLFNVFLLIEGGNDNQLAMLHDTNIRIKIMIYDKLCVNL